MNTGTKFTPGPYHVEKSCGRYEIWPKNRKEAHSYIGVVQTEADADFLAAAPEMFAALEALLTASEICDSSEPEPSDICHLQECHEAARAALAKAKGGAK